MAKTIAAELKEATEHNASLVAQVTKLTDDLAAATTQNSNLLASVESARTERTALEMEIAELVLSNKELQENLDTASAAAASVNRVAADKAAAILGDAGIAPVALGTGVAVVTYDEHWAKYKTITNASDRWAYWQNNQKEMTRH